MPKDVAANKTDSLAYIDLRKFIGTLGLAFPIVVPGLAILAFGQGPVGSLSAYYYTASGIVFVGALWAIGFFMLSYQAYGPWDTWAGRLACLFAVLMTLFPTLPPASVHCAAGAVATSNPPCPSAMAALIGVYPTSVVHFVAAALFFATLIFFSLVLFTRTNMDLGRKRKDTDPQKAVVVRKKRRNLAYRICGVIMIVCILLCFVFSYYNLPIVIWEALAVWAFGFSWLTKANLIPILREKVPAAARGTTARPASGRR